VASLHYEQHERDADKENYRVPKDCACICFRYGEWTIIVELALFTELEKSFLNNAR